jgi:hypothetical protein
MSKAAARFNTAMDLWDHIERSTDQTYVVAERLSDGFSAFVKDRAVWFQHGRNMQ